MCEGVFHENKLHPSYTVNDSVALHLFDDDEINEKYSTDSPRRDSCDSGTKLYDSSAIFFDKSIRGRNPTHKDDSINEDTIEYDKFHNTDSINDDDNVNGGDSSSNEYCIRDLEQCTINDKEKKEKIERNLNNMMQKTEKIIMGNSPVKKDFLTNTAHFSNSSSPYKGSELNSYPSHLKNKRNEVQSVDKKKMKNIYDDKKSNRNKSEFHDGERKNNYLNCSSILDDKDESDYMRHVRLHNQQPQSRDSTVTSTSLNVFQESRRRDVNSLVDLDLITKFRLIFLGVVRNHYLKQVHSGRLPRLASKLCVCVCVCVCVLLSRCVCVSLCIYLSLVNFFSLSLSFSLTLSLSLYLSHLALCFFLSLCTCLSVRYSRFVYVTLYLYLYLSVSLCHGIFSSS